MNYTAILLAAGKGARTGLDYNKAFYMLPTNKSVLQSSMDVFEQDPDCEKIVIVCAPHEQDYVQEHYIDRKKNKAVCTPGGSTRQDSVWNGLQLADTPYVMIHDAARPYLRSKRLEDLKKALENFDACLLAVPSVDTIKVADGQGIVQNTPDRALIWNAQTPQAFATSCIKKAHEQAKKSGYTGTDDCSLVEVFSSTPVKIVPGDPDNIKITNPQDVK